MIGAITIVLLFMMFGSLVIPLKAIVLNLLSLSATFGAMVWIFQEGHLSGVLRFTATGGLAAAMPILMPGGRPAGGARGRGRAGDRRGARSWGGEPAGAYPPMTDQAAAVPPAAPAPAGRRARSRKGEGWRLRDEILDATEALLLQIGAAEHVSIRAVADAVGVTPPSIYRHFPDKDSLIYEVWDRRCGTLDVAFEEAVTGIDDPVEALHAIGRAYVRFGLANPEPYRLVFMTRADRASPEEDAERLGQIKAFTRAVDLVQQCMDAGRMLPEFTDAFAVATIVWAHVHGLVSLMITKTDFPWPRDPEWLDLAVASCATSFLRAPDDR